MSDNPFKNAEYLRKPSGVILMNGEEVAHTRQCCHGGEHFVSIKGSGIRRGYCPHCVAVTCGRPECDRCVPYEEKMEVAEGKSLSKSKYADTIRAIEAKHPGVILF